MKAVRGVVLSAFPGCDTRCCQGRRGAGPVVMARPGRLRVRRGESGATGSAGRSSGVDRVERGRFRRPPLRPDCASRMVGRRLACRDAAGPLGPPACGWTTVFREPGGPTARRWSKRGSTAMTPLNNLQSVRSRV